MNEYKARSYKVSAQRNIRGAFHILNPLDVKFRKKNPEYFNTHCNNFRYLTEKFTTDVSYAVCSPVSQAHRGVLLVS